MNRKLYLVEDVMRRRRKGTWRERTYSASERVLADGIYSVEHEQHRLPTEVTLEAGSDFPGCAACRESVTFRFVRKLENSDGFHIKLWALPVLPEDEAQTPGKTA